jgi:hypothetical protein
MKTIVSHALPETVPDTMPVAEATDATVLATIAHVATAGRGHGRSKKVVVLSLVKPKKELTSEERRGQQSLGS